MSFGNIFQIANSAMSAQNIRLNTTASNLANVDTVAGSPEQAYKSRQPIFAAVLANFDQAEAIDHPESVGVKVLGVVENQKAAQQEYRPDHPLADENGFIYKPNVNPMEEMANMISASRSYQVNAQVVDTAKQMAQRTLSLGQ